MIILQLWFTWIIIKSQVLIINVHNFTFTVLQSWVLLLFIYHILLFHLYLTAVCLPYSFELLLKAVVQINLPFLAEPNLHTFRSSFQKILIINCFTFIYKQNLEPFFFLCWHCEINRPEGGVSRLHPLPPPPCFYCQVKLTVCSTTKWHFYSSSKWYIVQK